MILSLIFKGHKKQVWKEMDCDLEKLVQLENSRWKEVGGNWDIFGEVE